MNSASFRIIAYLASALLCFRKLSLSQHAKAAAEEAGAQLAVGAAGGSGRAGR